MSKLPKTIYVAQPPGSVNFLEAHERLIDFERGKEMDVGEYQLKDVVRWTSKKETKP
jgi:hypothetical protein